MKDKRSLVNQTIEALMAFIHAEEYEIGQKLPVEAELARQLKVGRSTLREAVKILAFSNILEVKQGSGTFLKNKSFKEEFSTEELLTARVMLEAQAVELIIQQEYEITQMLELKEILFKRNQLLAEGKFSEFVDVDEAFHLFIINLSKNPLLIRWYNEILPDLKLYQSAEVIKTANYEDNTELHDGLYEAIIEKDLAKAIGYILKNSRK